MNGYEPPQIAVIKNDRGYHLELLMDVPEDRKIRSLNSFVTAIPIKDMSIPRFNELDTATNQGLDYLALELAEH